MSAPRLPDFIIAGAPRSGTTWLWRLAELHPAISMAKPIRPEPKFFLVDELYAKGLDWYSATWFAATPIDLVAGEKSANYMESATAACRIAQDLPRVKLVFMLRNPIDRAYSNYLWSKSNGLEREDFVTALAEESAREGRLPAALRFARPHDYFMRGCYYRHLEEYFAHFGRDRILVMRYEDIIEQPAEVANKLHRFLGVAERPQDAGAPELAAREADRPQSHPLATALRRELARRYLEPTRRLVELLGPDFPLWPEIEVLAR